MALMQNKVTVAAGSVSLNVIAGQLHEILQRPSACRVSVNGSAPGLFVTVIIGSMVVIQDQAVNSQNRFPLIPDDVLATAGGMQGEKLNVVFRNGTAGPLDAFWRVDVDAVA
jgi:hypothetical protein